MIRALAFLIIAIIAVAAVLASNHAKQIASAPLVQAQYVPHPPMRLRTPCGVIPNSAIQQRRLIQV